MTFLRKSNFGILCLLSYVLLRNVAVSRETKRKEENRPYEFSFNIVDFQHRFEKKDSEGIITGEYGFVTADGVYRETSYATDRNGDFIITGMRNRKITSLKDAREIFKDRPEAAKKLVEAVARACSSCKIPIEENNPTDAISTTPIPVSTTKSNLNPVLREMMKSLIENRRTGEEGRTESPQGRNGIPENSKDLLSQRRGKSLEEGTVRSMADSARKLLQNNSSSIGKATNGRVLRKMANELFYRFNYTITSHEHQEDGYRSGEKDGSYRARGESGVDTRVKYVSNEFGHQPNISFVPQTNSGNETERLKGYSFLWYLS